MEGEPDRTGGGRACAIRRDAGRGPPGLGRCPPVRAAWGVAAAPCGARPEANFHRVISDATRLWRRGYMFAERVSRWSSGPGWPREGPPPQDRQRSERGGRQWPL